MLNEHFPVTYSTLRADILASHVLTHYGIGHIHDCRLWKRGLSDVYLVHATDQQYVLRVSHTHWRSFDDIHFEMELLDFLHQRHVPVSHPLATCDGQLMLEINAPEGSRFATLMTYAPGEIALGDFNQAQSHGLGQILAKLHIATTDFQTKANRQPLDLEHLLNQSLNIILPQVQNPSTASLLQATGDELHQALRSLPQESPFWVICWGDPHSGNVHCTSDQQMTLFDFDQCGYGWRAFDVAKFLQMALCSGMRYSVRDAFVDGYQNIQPLTHEEIIALMPLTQVAHLWRWAISLNHALMNEYSRLDNFYFLHRIEQLKMLKNNDWQSLQKPSRTLASY
ncbi:phosphotransferase [filamentous cyanobacterium LEGE 11480]|uniref:Phosphotransferase n=1 Tax=Romeriopsis navalis LEGE 11480 TaxID=2777977 RepID=A0A928VHH5_9CYAN|nr:phosphotransferase [Romeriopsis navalis]MBE9028425.1 phosphotransferase [Romeriopsis navalis LEGE 11480]